MSAAVNPSQSAFVFDRTPDVDRTPQGATVSDIYKGPNDPAIKAAFYATLTWDTPHSVYAESILSRTSEKIIGTGAATTGMVEISLIYTPVNNSASGILGMMRPGESTLESDSNAVQQPIEKAPPEWIRSGGTQLTWNDALPALKETSLAGVENWLDPQPIVTRTDAVESSSFSFTESEVTGDVGQVMTGGAMALWGVLSCAEDSNGNSRWLYANKRVTKNGEVVTVTRTAQYNREGWETAYIYNGGGDESPENP